jgi:myosin protein heavy chain
MGDISCDGGGDDAEDIRGGIKQMISNLKWSKTFKIAMLICDAPTHGARYNGGEGDDYPDEDIKDSIKMLIQNNIFFVGILFNKTTFQMFEEIKKIYKAYDREELLLLADLEGTTEGLNNLTIM